ncbi:sporulation/spore germination protein [Deinococcus actinosclerus]|uniref:Sporulation/spore germination protein n=1 Tax=Deinococcus actinosclerus TaxID=1768108 RepID=A0ABN4K627_9DEIO|nr:GerMN domain-containing protein [Deinococcus actinosclerus]ALW89520.1 sporulation/spore germination protein [Deinococcus actinosclerus]
MSVPRKLFSPFNVVAAGLLAVSVLALQAVQRTPPTPEPPKLELTERQTLKVKVYFTDLQVQTLKAETRTVQVSRTNTRSVAQAAVDVWARGPYDKSFLGVVPTGTPSPKVYLRGQHYYVDLPDAYTKLRYGASGERMLLCTLTRTLLEQKGQDVTFLVAGQGVEALGRMDLTQPFTAGDCADQ